MLERAETKRGHVARQSIDSVWNCGDGPHFACRGIDATLGLVHVGRGTCTSNPQQPYQHVFFHSNIYVSCIGNLGCNGAHRLPWGTVGQSHFNPSPVAVVEKNVLFSCRVAIDYVWGVENQTQLGRLVGHCGVDVCSKCVDFCAPENNIISIIIHDV